MLNPASLQRVHVCVDRLSPLLCSWLTAFILFNNVRTTEPVYLDRLHVVPHFLLK